MNTAAPLNTPPRTHSESSDESTQGKGRNDTSDGGVSNRRVSMIDDRPLRAPQACSRCRRKKLRCAGGCPCSRCIRAQEKCDFGGRPPNVVDQSAGLDPSIRIAQLEKTVADLLTGMSGTDRGSLDGKQVTTVNPQISPRNETQQITDVFDLSPSTWGFGVPSNIMTNNIGNAPTTAPAAPTMTAMATMPPFVSPPQQQAVPLTVAPPVPFTNTERQVTFGPSPAESHATATGSAGHKDSPEDRLAAASQAGQTYAPFRPLTYQPALWENKEQSRRQSPQPGGGANGDSSDSLPDGPWATFEAKAGPTDEPVSCGLVDEDMAKKLLEFFFERCHPFLPIVNVSTVQIDRHADIRHRSAFLYTAILAIAARFYVKHSALPSGVYALTSAAAAGMARLAYSHLAASLFRKQHQLADVQATLLLGGWGLQAGGGGPDPWLVTGHCARLAHRLGLHRASSLHIPPLNDLDDHAKDKRVSQWRTWACWYYFDGFLSLGFGRPQSQCPDGTSEQMLVHPGPGISDVELYLSSLAQLTKIGRDLIDWVQLLSDLNARDFRGPLLQNGQDLSICSMLRHLNKRMDDWNQTWTWNGSLAAIQLGTRSSLVRLQSEHIRLCLNSLALRAGLVEMGTTNPAQGMLSNNGSLAGEDSALIITCIKRAAESAINTVQAHADSAKSNMALSFSIDYITIALGQAAVFLIRLHSAQHDIPVDRAVVAHYLKTAIGLLEDTDMSETRNSTYVGKVCRDLSRVAGIDIPPRNGVTEESPTQRQIWTDAGLPLVDQDFDIEGFLQFDNSGLDLGMLFGLPTDGLDSRFLDFGMDNEPMM